jgi:hypothetical protein
VAAGQSGGLTQTQQIILGVVLGVGLFLILLAIILAVVIYNCTSCCRRPRVQQTYEVNSEFKAYNNRRPAPNAPSQQQPSNGNSNQVTGI